jgi:hypothetical protein
MRLFINLLDEYIPVIAGTELNDDRWLRFPESLKISSQNRETIQR